MNLRHLTAVINALQAIGATVVSDGADRLQIIPADRYSAINVTTSPYPDFPTDMQAQLMALLTLCEGTSNVIETIFENRLRHVSELNRMGADIYVKGNHAVVRECPS